VSKTYWKKMNIGILVNNSQIAYQAIGVFYQNISKTLSRLGHTIFEIFNIDEYESIHLKNKLDVTINIGKYNIFKNNIPAYDFYGIPHFNWIIDNPIKMSIDLRSLNIFYVFIDKEFLRILEDLNKNRCLFLPLGTEIGRRVQNVKKENDILFAGQIKDSNSIYKDILGLNTLQKKAISQIVETTLEDLNQSFIKRYIKIINQNKSQYKPEDKKNIFKWSNSYIRAYKRKLLMKNIKNNSLLVYGRIEDNEILKQRNITIKNPIPYYELLDLYSKSKISINVNPNFSYSCHDRILNSISRGSCCLTDKNEYLARYFIDMESILFFDYNDLDSLDFRLSEIFEKKLYGEICDRGLAPVKANFSWDVILPKLLNFIRAMTNVVV
jgi:glycosyltransferase involved in cell wall biosynthesis